MLLITQPIPTACLQTPPRAGQDPSGHFPPRRAATSQEQPPGDQAPGDGGKWGWSSMSDYAAITVSKITGTLLKIAADGRVAKHV